MDQDASASPTPGGERAAAYEARALELSRIAIGGYRTAIDIPYGTHPLQRLDVIAPPDAEGLPVLLFFHGGGFTHGTKAWGGFMAPALGNVVLVLADYRLIPEVDPATQMEDALSAMRWVAQHIGDWGGDKARLHVGGHSAGAAIAALLALAPDAGIAGAICLSTSFNRLAVTGTPGAAYELPPGPIPVDGNAPLAHLRPDIVARFFIAWGGQERQRPRVERSSMAMIEALRDRDVPVEWHFAPDADHFDTHLLFANTEHYWSRALRHWIAAIP